MSILLYERSTKIHHQNDTVIVKKPHNFENFSQIFFFQSCPKM